MEAQAPPTVARGKVITDRWHTREQKPASKEVMADLDSFDLPLAAKGGIRLAPPDSGPPREVATPTRKRCFPTQRLASSS
jgi:hypothetical protein